MNKLKTWNDGSYMPVWQKDLEFIQEAFKTPFVKLCETLLGKTSGIICGCKVANRFGYTVITEGLVLMEGEIVYCPTQSMPGNLTFLEKVDVFDETGDKVFKINDGTDVRQTYYTPQATLTDGLSMGSPDDVILLLNTEGKKTLLECLFEKMYEMALAMPYDVITSTATGTTSEYSIKYAKIGKKVFILALSGSAGGLDPGGGSGGSSEITYGTLWTMPAGFRPAVETFFSYKINATHEVHLGSVLTNGAIRIENYKNITAVAFSFLT